MSFRLDQPIYTALANECIRTGKNKSELVTEYILAGLKAVLQPVDNDDKCADPLEVRMMALETQMLAVIDRLDSIADIPVRIDRDKQPLVPSEPLPAKDIPIATPIDPKTTAISAEPEQPEPKRSPVSSRDSGRGATSTADIQQNIIAVLKPYPAGGCYFRSEQLGQTKILGTYRTQAMEMGFSSEAVSIDGEKIRVWLNRSYCLDSTATV
jgi:hypothetical protein